MGLVVTIAGAPESTPTGYHTKEAAQAPTLMSSRLAEPGLHPPGGKGVREHGQATFPLPVVAGLSKWSVQNWQDLVLDSCVRVCVHGMK